MPCVRHITFQQSRKIYRNNVFLFTEEEVDVYDEEEADVARYDFYKHAAAFDNKKSATRCTLCRKTTHMTCLKCGINLCLVKGRNCFNTYHGYPENPTKDFFLQ